MASAPSAPSLEEARRAYRSCSQAHGGHCEDHIHVEALVDLLEAEVARLRRESSELQRRLDRSGTVYHVPPLE
jgi:hypothetical protein